MPARWSRSPVPTMARSRSDDTTWSAANHSPAHVDFPHPAGPTSTTRHGSGSRTVSDTPAVSHPLPTGRSPAVPGYRITRSPRTVGGLGSPAVENLTNRQVVLRRRPTGLVQPDDVELVEAPVPELAEGEALVRTTYLGIDAAVRTWLDDARGYLPPVAIGDPVRAAGVGEVVATRCDAYAVGDVVTHLPGFQELAVVRDDVFTTVIPGVEDQLAMLTVYGATGATAYFGMTDIGRPQPGETVVVSAAAGATGSLAGQIAKIAGARVVGIAGGPEKGAVVVDEFGFDACVDHQGRRPGRPAEGALPRAGRRLLRQRGRAHPRRRPRPAGPGRPGRAVRGDLQLPHRRAPRARATTPTCWPAAA